MDEKIVDWVGSYTTTKVAVEAFSVSFRHQHDGSVDYCIVRPDMCFSAGKAKNFKEFFKNVMEVHRLYAELHGVDVKNDW